MTDDSLTLEVALPDPEGAIETRRWALRLVGYHADVEVGRGQLHWSDVSELPVGEARATVRRNEVSWRLRLYPDEEGRARLSAQPTVSPAGPGTSASPVVLAATGLRSRISRLLRHRSG